MNSVSQPKIAAPAVVPPPPCSAVLTIKETADYLRIPLPTVYYMVQRGQLPAVQLGGRWRLKRDALDALFGQASEAAQLSAIGGIREVVEREPGKLMLSELVQTIRNLKDAEKQLREGVIEFIKDEDAPRDALKFLLDETQWWEWDTDSTPPNVSGHPQPGVTNE